jgi:hypothetical protein
MHIDTGSSVPGVPSKSRDLADDHSEEKADIIYTLLKRSIFDMF